MRKLTKAKRAGRRRHFSSPPIFFVYCFSSLDSSSFVARLVLCSSFSLSSGKHAEALPFQFRFEDGTERPATSAEIIDIAMAYWSALQTQPFLYAHSGFARCEAVFVPWQLGDIVIFDNQLVAHDATPGLGARSIMPSFGQVLEPKRN